jgi:hypothetical protein
VTENTPLPAPPPGYTFDPPSYDPAIGKVTITAKGGEYTVTVKNELTRTSPDSATLKFFKTLGNVDSATVPTTYVIKYDCGTNHPKGSVTVTANSATSVDVIVDLYDATGNLITPSPFTCMFSEDAQTPIPGYTWATPVVTPTSAIIPTNLVAGAVTVTAANSITRDRGTIIVIKNAQPREGQFTFTTTGTGYQGVTLTGATTNSGNINSQTLDTGTYTVSESTQLSWILTGIGGGLPVNPDDPLNTKFYCTVTVVGSDTSVGIGDLLTASAAITLGKNDTVTCTFENTGAGATRTQGFWATHTPLAKIAWFGGTFGTKVVHTFPGVAATTGIMNTTLCNPVKKDINDLPKLMGGFWSDISKTTLGKKRSALDQARMQLLQQLLAAELNASAFGALPSGGSTMFNQWEAAYCGSDAKAISTAQGQAAAFNSRGDTTTFTPGTSADSKNARAIANRAYWDVLP